MTAPPRVPALATLRGVLAARHSSAVLPAVVAVLVLCWLWGDTTIALDFAYGRRGRTVYFAEVFGVVTGAVLVIMLRPRMLYCERLGARRVRAVAALFAVVGLAAAVLPVAAAVPSFVTGSPWQYMLPNILTLTALGFIVSALVSPASGAAVSVGLFCLIAVLQNVAPAVTRPLPVGRMTEEGVWFEAPVWSGSIALCIVAVAVQYATCGGTSASLDRVRNT